MGQFIIIIAVVISTQKMLHSCFFKKKKLYENNIHHIVTDTPGWLKKYKKSTKTKPRQNTESMYQLDSCKDNLFRWACFKMSVFSLVLV